MKADFNLAISVLGLVTFGWAVHPMSALAGRDSGGGQVVNCQSKPTVTLDYYNAIQQASSSSKVLDPEREDILNILVQRLNDATDSTQTSFTEDGLKIGDWLKKTIQDFGPLNSWKNADLKFIDDHQLIYLLPPECQLEQAAAQDLEGKKTAMFQNLAVTQNLSRGQKRMLEVHEALYLLVRQHLCNNSKPVRVLLETMLLSDLSSKDRDSAFNNFVETLSENSKRFVCSSLAYLKYPTFTQTGRINPRNPQNVSAYGRTYEEAFQNLQVSVGSELALCSQIEYEKYDDGSPIAYRATCSKVANIHDSCLPNTSE